MAISILKAMAYLSRNTLLLFMHAHRPQNLNNELNILVPRATILLTCGRDRELWPDPIFWACAEYSFHILRALDPCRRSEWSWALGTRMRTKVLIDTFTPYQIGGKAHLWKNGTFLKNPIWWTKTKNVINVCIHKFACTNVTPKRRNGAHFETHAPYCAWVITMKISEISTKTLEDLPRSPNVIQRWL